MALSIGNKTNNLATPAASTQTFAHNHDVGADGYLFLMTAMSNTTTVTGVTYNSVAMTNIADNVTTGTGMRWTVWRLASPATGSNNVVLTFGIAQFNPVSSECLSVLGSSGEGNIGFTNTGGPPQTVAVTVSANSIIFCGGIAGAAGTNVTINGSSRTIDWNNAANNRHFGGVSALALPAGSITSSVNSSASCAISSIEIKEAGGGGGATSKNTQAVLI